MQQDAVQSVAKSHAAGGAWQGFYYQAFYALLLLLQQDSDDAAVGVEQLDDVELKVDGYTLLHQLKHSVAASPSPVTVKSVALWKTIKAWVDILPAVVLAETSFHLVTVAELANDSPLSALITPGSDQTALVAALEAEAQRVLDERKAAAEKKDPLPHAERAGGCEAFLGLGETVRANLVRSMHIQPGTLTLGQIEQEIAGRLKFIQPKDRPAVAARLVQWWDREIVYTLCGQREPLISRAELQQKISAIIAEIEQDLLTPDFEGAPPPDDYLPDGMLARQIQLVNGLTSDLKSAIREEWRAREQRGKWTNANPAMATTIGDYDLLLQEEWSDRHAQMSEECEGLGEAETAQAGLKLLRWSHLEAPNTTRPITKGWDAAYYVRGSYQVLAISLKVGWHADYRAKLGGDM
ncbi:ABC-three component system protein [Brevundimonas aurantiaca]|uniref:ABC-three component system protein n=1 Tax=Brevundimonas aurantiaca TaxID=74316 RepID=UPI00174E4226|nr:ABC-three component system protein [Brevundimonas aurantiaca]